jgi:hypothetical protein
MNVQVSAKELKELRRAKAKLSALEAGGVDNWEWYGESLKEFRKESELEELIDDAIEDILECASENGSVEYPAGMECGSSILLGDAEDGVRALLEKFAQSIIDMESR